MGRYTLIFLVLAAHAVSTAAQSLVMADAPSPQIGDAWKYQVLDGWTNRESSQYQLELVAVEDSGFVFRSSTAAAVRTSRNLEPCRTLRGSVAPICTGSLRFPMKVGDKYDFKELPWTNGNGHYSESCAVTGSEAVTVPAGTFQTLKIECDGTWTRVFEGSGSGKVTETLWYSPKVNRLVKSAYDDRNAAGKLENRSITELVEFAAK